MKKKSIVMLLLLLLIPPIDRPLVCLHTTLLTYSSSLCLFLHPFPLSLLPFKQQTTMESAFLAILYLLCSPSPRSALLIIYLYTYFVCSFVCSYSPLYTCTSLPSYSDVSSFIHPPILGSQVFLLPRISVRLVHKEMLLLYPVLSFMLADAGGMI